VALIVSANVTRRQMTKYQSAMARAIGLAEAGLRKVKANGQGYWESGTDSGPDVSRTNLARCGAVLDYDADRGTDYADQVLTGALTLDDAYRIVNRARRAEQDAKDAAARAEAEAAETARRTLHRLG
jgi:hypothetical protein